MKKPLLFLIALMLFSTTSSFAQDCDDFGIIGELQWCLKNGTLTISGNGPMPDFVFYGNRAPWFPYYESIFTVVIEEGVTTIGQDAFNCIFCTSVTIPNSVTSIGKGAFNVSRLTSVTIPANVKTIGQSAFMGCYYLQTVNFNATYCTTTQGTAYYPPFYYCDSFTTLNIGNNVTHIPSYLFNACNELTSITTLAHNPPTLGNKAFGEVQANIPVYIPCLSLSAYQSQWNYFSNFICDSVPPIITTTALPDGLVDTAYNAQLEAISTIPITWSLSSGNLPNGLTLSSEVGIISGTPNTAGTFNFTVKATNSEGSDIQALSIKIENGVGVLENEMENIQLYPNPTNGELRIESRELKIKSVEIFDVYGKKVLMSLKSTLNISHFPTGIYFVKIYTEKGEIVKKVLKE